MSKNNLLFLTPCVPSVTRQGTGMRAGAILEALAEHYSVYLFGVDFFQRTGETENIGKRFAVKSVTSNEEDVWTGNAIVRPEDAFPGVEFQALYVLRLMMVPFAPGNMLRDANTFCALDLDDYESKKSAEIARLLTTERQVGAAATANVRSLRFRKAETAHIPRFRNLFASNDKDRLALAAEFRSCNVVTVPNVIRLPAPLPAVPPEPAARILFVGSLGIFRTKMQ